MIIIISTTGFYDSLSLPWSIFCAAAVNLLLRCFWICLTDGELLTVETMSSSSPSLLLSLFTSLTWFVSAWQGIEKKMSTFLSIRCRSLFLWTASASLFFKVSLVHKKYNHKKKSRKKVNTNLTSSLQGCLITSPRDKRPKFPRECCCREFWVSSCSCLSTTIEFNWFHFDGFLGFASDDCWWPDQWWWPNW